jgi:hypothetical protein
MMLTTFEVPTILLSKPQVLKHPTSNTQGKKLWNTPSGIRRLKTFMALTLPTCRKTALFLNSKGDTKEKPILENVYKPGQELQTI